MAKDKKIKPTGPMAHNPFAALAAQVSGGADKDEAASKAESREPEKKAAATPQDWGDNKIVLRREKKGRGGKTVTRVCGLPEARLPELHKRMKKQLGCGATIDGPDLLLHGSLTDRAAEWLKKAGARKVIVGN